MRRVLITGGAGYVGNVLTPQLLDAGYPVTVYDICFFGSETLPEHPLLEIIRGDIRDNAKLDKAFDGIDTVLHLACISNDPSFALDESLSKSINFDCFEPMVESAKRSGVRRFIYASTSSVYGVSDQPNVTEDHPLVPLTLYNKFKGMCEPLLLRHLDDTFEGVILRPATICGYSPRQRLDLSVNILTTHAVVNRKIKVFGGEQLRPNLHVNDMADAYQLFIEAPADRIRGQTFNIGYQNHSIAEIAEIVRDVVGQEFSEGEPIEIERTSSDDDRSYHINSDKIHRMLGFAPRRSVEDAVRDLCAAFRLGKLPNPMDDDRYYNVRTMKSGHAV